MVESPKEPIKGQKSAEKPANVFIENLLRNQDIYHLNETSVNTPMQLKRA